MPVVSFDNMRHNRINWYRTPIEPHALAALTKRSDWQGFSHIIAHMMLLTFTGSLAYWCYLGQHFLLALAVLLIHGTCYSFLGWAGAGHELIHRTVFKTKVYNDFFLFLFAFLTWNNYVYFLASHVRHHKATVFDKLDGEVRLPQSFRFSDWGWALTFDFPACYRAIRIVVENSFGIIKGEWGATLFPESDGVSRRKVIRCARIVLLGHMALAISFVASGNGFLLLVLTFAPFIAVWLNKVLALAQHFGMKSNVDDFRLNCRTVLLHPFLSFLYWQMNYHMEHHMYPGVPFYNLKRLRNKLEYNLPPSTEGLSALLCEMALINRKQRQVSS